MAYRAIVLADSTDGTDLPGNRLTTVAVTLPKCIVAEFNTHRALSRNSASSRAIPTARIIQSLIEDPYIPEWGRNASGMQSKERLSEDEALIATQRWLLARDSAIEHARRLHSVGVHKQTVNRILEPWIWTTIIATATDVGWSHFFGLRCDEAADPAIRRAAVLMRDAMAGSNPKEMQPGEWHLPLIDAEDRERVREWLLTPPYGAQTGGLVIPGAARAFHILARISAARCGRVSYLRHEEKRPIEEDLARAQSFIDQRHPSPLEHQAMLASSVGMVPTMTGNFGHCRWWQFRKIVGQ